MNQIFFALPGNEQLATNLAEQIGSEKGEAIIRQFPDGETYVRIESDVSGKQVVLVCTLDHPDQKLLPLYFLSKTAKSLGAQNVLLIAPYLAYMRQDKRFQPGEGITSEYFAALVSQFANAMITIDPHLHRRSSLAEIYTIPTIVLHAADLISDWVKNNVNSPIFIGPDEESEQWVKQVAENAGAPYLVLKKIRLGDKDVEVSVPDVERYRDHTPVLVDDIISTARTMIETIGHLQKAAMKKPVCIGVHGIFSGSAYEELITAGAGEVITTNTIPHSSNKIAVEGLIVPRILTG